MVLADPWHTWSCIWRLFTLLHTLTVFLNSVWICFIHFYFLAYKRKKKCCQLNIAMACYSQTVSTFIPAGCNLIAVSQRTVTLYNSQDRMQARPYRMQLKGQGKPVSTDAITRCELWPRRSEQTLFKKCYGIFNAPKSLQSWHHVLLETEPSRALIMCCGMDPVLLWGRELPMASLLFKMQAFWQPYFCIRACHYLRVI